MEIIISGNSSKPIYAQITEQLKAQIMDGHAACRRIAAVYAKSGEVPACQRDYGAAGV